MKKTLIALALLCAAQVSAQTVVQQFVAISRGAGTVSDMDLEPTAEGSTLIAMPFEVTPGIKVLSVTDNAPAGSNTYKEVPGSVASCSGALLDIWYCEKCNSKLYEEFFHLTDITTQLAPVFERFYANEANLTCKSCGTKMAKRS